MQFKMMKQGVGVLFVVAALLAGIVPVGAAQTVPALGKPPPMPVKGVDVRTDQPVVIEKTDEYSMLVLCFFALGSPTSEEGLRLLNTLQKDYRGLGLNVVAVSPKDSPAQLRSFAMNNGLCYTILADQDRQISRRYGAGTVFPLTFIIAPYVPQLTNVLVGGGKGTQKILAAIAEKYLSQGRPENARAVAEKAVAADPKDADAKAILAYSFLAEGKIAEAERMFEEVKGLRGGEAPAMAGLARVRLDQGRLDEASNLAEAAHKKAPDWAPVARIIKAEVYQRQGKTEQAEFELRAAAGSGGPDWQRSEALDKLGRIQAERGDLKEAVKTYSRALDIDPYNLEVLSNKGVAHEELGEHDEAIAALETAKLLNSQDEIVIGLLRDAVRAQREANDLERQKLIRAQVDTLAARFKEQRAQAPEVPVDEWTSRPLTLAVLDFGVEGGMLERAGMDRVILNQFTAALEGNARVTLVERAIIDKLLTELNLSSTELADPETRLRLGRLLSARLVAVGSFVTLDRDLMFNVRIIDTETSRVVTSVSPNLSAHAGIGPMAVGAAEKCSAKLASAYPLRGRIVYLKDEVGIDLGARHGVVPGTKFRVVREGEPIKDSRGRVLTRKQETVATLDVKRVEDAISYTAAPGGGVTLKVEDKVIEER